jgi:hypothetical protein
LFFRTGVETAAGDPQVPVDASAAEVEFGQIGAELEARVVLLVFLMALQRAGRQEHFWREDAGSLCEIGRARTVRLGVYRSSNATSPGAPTRLIGLRAPPGALTNDVVFVRKAVLTVLMIEMSGLACGTRLPFVLIPPKL